MQEMWSTKAYFTGQAAQCIMAEAPNKLETRTRYSSLEGNGAKTQLQASSISEPTKMAGPFGNICVMLVLYVGLVAGEVKYTASIQWSNNGHTVKTSLDLSSCTGDIKDSATLANLIKESAIRSLKNSEYHVSWTPDHASSQPRQCSYGQKNLIMYWSMDRFVDEKLRPEVNKEDISFDDVYTANTEGGFYGKALHLTGNEGIILMNDVKICPHDLDKCGESGLSVLFWLKMKSWGSQERKIVFRTSTADKDSPGIYFGTTDSRPDVDVYVRTELSDVRYDASIPRSLISSDWTHVGIVWNKLDGIKVSINGSFLISEDYSLVSNMTTVMHSHESEMDQDFILGTAGGPAFLLDELKIYESSLSDFEIQDSMRPGVLYEDALYMSGKTYRLLHNSENWNHSELKALCIPESGGALALINDPKVVRISQYVVHMNASSRDISVRWLDENNESEPCTYARVKECDEATGKLEMTRHSCDDEYLAHYALCEWNI